ncbi:tRNA dihydrouridine synthase DusB [Staphylococcus pseudintermedius]|uniref:tRNA-dihydrouridine synthase n=7 Tax=Staphylococcus intermedius group TaxID=2815305 RepID=A0A2A4H9G0_9STAP|nr:MULTISPECIES: tRNA dihydrouridine synthase DusB [Staphylococcus intermedius group]ADX77513.1 dihydrouridine synthase TIM-barrel protein, putative [Staphylococcus pseudintermedius ED99]ASQ51491.1 tRNA-dihydrouridine synthase [Staphylococcus pseudintermedius]AYG55220.1 tRNA dihydrouridine synthase DusB [Staphylococcus pseudintermedius]EGQ0288218.1 tRNA dihydrouridine synthase DusB [Staphylococcus pseudintermedius]EGQ0290920.1 tRNA dihydrouridine synthase DusB [Staphylococcus pseudintermedius]
MWKIGDVEIENRVVLAPMAGVCNSAFRLTVKEFGAGLVCAEMVSDKAILFNNPKTMKMLYIDENERPLSLQIFGGEKETLVEAAEYVDKNTTADIIDINMGCPVSKIIKCEAGARWLLDPNKIYEMVSAVTERVSKPVTCKMRIGWDEDHIFAVENAKAAERAGAAAISLHGRTRVQMYEGKADWDIIRQVKEAVNIPVIGNGDVTSPELAEKMLKETGVDAVMIGREALGNPWMIYRTVHYLETGELIDEPQIDEKIEIALLHLNRLVDLKGEKVGVMEMRKHASWYLKGVRGNGKARKALNQAETLAEMTEILTEFRDEQMEKQKIEA